MPGGLFIPFTLREVRFANRIFLSPMCQYSAENGAPTDWHLVHLGSRAVGGAGLVLVEATAVCPEGRISPVDLGLWSDDQTAAFRRITPFMRAQGAAVGVQLAHAGRKASNRPTWDRGAPLLPEDGGWRPLAPSSLPFDPSSQVPLEMTASDIERVVQSFEAAARRALEAGFQVVEIHMAHGYLLHQFLSPLANRRTDRFGGSLENRMQLPLAVAAAVRRAWPAVLPLLARVSATDWMDDGWDLEQTITLCRRLKEIGVDMIDCSSGGLDPGATAPNYPGYQTPFATTIRREVGIPTGAVGLIQSPQQADQIVSTGQADVVLLGRELLRDPYWPLHAARTLGVDVPWPRQYLRAKS
ncbi:MAG: NADH:flavin oxidoreductase/NADH oxidase [Candidatus Riflebacteria bacterium]|nr:NADH:flavin oxidoreductase/NADH oxidase [Candidatus Riflebacteria bacterium]